MTDFPNLVSKALPGPKAKKIIDRDAALLSQSYTRDYPLVIAQGRGCMVTDPDGNTFLDCAAGIAVCATGHSHPHVVDAIKAQASKFIHMSGTDFFYAPQVDLAERLAKHAPFKGRAKLFFTNSGAEAVEAAMKLARHHTKRERFIAFYGAFHGRTMGALSLTASKVVQKKSFGPFVPGVHHIQYCNPTSCADRPNDGTCCMRHLDDLENIAFQKLIDPGNVAAIFVEPIQGEGGYVVPAPGFLERLRKICDQHGILLVFDEVQSGFGRTGKFFAAEHSGVEPDIITMAKGIASGMPLGGIMARESVMTWPYGAHASTFGGNPVACAAALATMDLLESKLIQNSAKVGRAVMKWTADWPKRHRIVKEIRGRGLMIGIEIETPDLRNRIVMDVFKEGLLILGCGSNAVRFCPPLIISEKQARWAIDALERVITRLEAESAPKQAPKQATKSAGKKKAGKKKPAKKTAAKKKPSNKRTGKRR